MTFEKDGKTELCKQREGEREREGWSLGLLTFHASLDLLFYVILISNLQLLHSNFVTDAISI